MSQRRIWHPILRRLDGAKVRKTKGHAMAKNAICVWYDKDAEAAARFYAATYPESAWGWCKDKLGVPWQITPRVLTDAMAAGGDEAKRAFEAMMIMRMIDVAAIEAARRGRVEAGTP